MSRLNHPHAGESRPQRSRAPVTDLPLFHAPAAPSGNQLHGGSSSAHRARASDPASSHAAAARAGAHLTLLQRRVLEAVRAMGPIDAAALERLPEFEHVGFSTVRKRVSELFGAGHIRVYDQLTRPGKAKITRWVAA